MAHSGPDHVMRQGDASSTPLSKEREPVVRYAEWRRDARQVDLIAFQRWHATVTGVSLIGLAWVIFHIGLLYVFLALVALALATIARERRIRRTLDDIERNVELRDETYVGVVTALLFARIKFCRMSALFGFDVGTLHIVEGRSVFQGCACAFELPGGMRRTYEGFEYGPDRLVDFRIVRPYRGPLDEQSWSDAQKRGVVTLAAGAKIWGERTDTLERVRIELPPTRMRRNLSTTVSIAGSLDSFNYMYVLMSGAVRMLPSLESASVFVLVVVSAIVVWMVIRRSRHTKENQALLDAYEATQTSNSATTNV